MDILPFNLGDVGVDSFGVGVVVVDPNVVVVEGNGCGDFGVLSTILFSSIDGTATRIKYLYNCIFNTFNNIIA